jgi:hypothetical protein
VGEDLEMATPRPSTPDQRSFVTRRSTLGFVALSLLSEIAYILLGNTVSGTATGFVAALTALMMSTSLISWVVAWIAGLVIGIRSRRLLWMLLACLPPPVGALACALWAPEAPAA